MAIVRRLGMGRPRKEVPASPARGSGNLAPCELRTRRRNDYAEVLERGRSKSADEGIGTENKRPGR